MNYIQKNRRNILVISAGVVLLVALIIWALQDKNYTSDDIVATMSPASITVGEPVNFEDNSPFGAKRKWIFNDGYESQQRKGSHVLQKDGYFTVTLIIDDQYIKNFPILVSPAASVTEAIPTSQTEILGPVQARQMQTVLFRAISDDAKDYNWSFGESGGVDAKDKIVSYAFEKPGTYKVRLYTDVDSDPISHKITILSAYPDAAAPEIKIAPPTMEEQVDKINDDFRYHLQQIAYGNNFNFHYYYLLRTYLCNKENVTVTAEDKNVSFYYYCTGLQFDKNNIIQEVNISSDAGDNCISKVEVKQSKVK